MFVRVGNKKIRIKDCSGLKSVSGLILDDMKKHSGALIYSNNIWMPFVKHELDLLFLDGEFRIIDIQKALPLTLNPKTWRVYKNNKAKYCLEIKTGLVRARELMHTIVHVHR